MCGPYEDKPTSEVWNKFADYYNLKYQQENVRPLGSWMPLYREQMGKFLFLVNGTGEKITDPDTKMEVDSFHMTVFYDGWICAVISPFEGTVLANTSFDIEDGIINILDKHIKKLKSNIN